MIPITAEILFGLWHRCCMICILAEEGKADDRHELNFVYKSGITPGTHAEVAERQETLPSTLFNSDYERKSDHPRVQGLQHARTFISTSKGLMYGEPLMVCTLTM